MNPVLSLLFVYALGKVWTVAFHGLWESPTTVLVLLWQDLLITLLLFAVSRVSNRVAWCFYILLLFEFAISMPLLKLMATPLTAPLLRAAQGTLADSISHHLDIENWLMIVGTMAVGGLIPVILRRVRWQPARIHLASAVIIIVVGQHLTPRSSLQGLHRNAAIALMSSFNDRQAHAVTPMAKVQSGQPPELHGTARGLNVLMIALESTGVRALASYGAALDPMPRLTKLAREGLLFENAYATFPESIKGLLTVLASKQTGFHLTQERYATAATPSVATVCARAGYETALFHSGRFMYLGMDDVVRSAGFQVAEDAGAIGGNHNSSFGIDDFSTVDRILRWIDSRTNSSPFFVHYLPVAGHHPYDSPEAGPFGDDTDSNRYLNALYYADRALDRLLSGLESRAIRDNTLLVIYGDHGEAFGEHPGNFGHTLFLYEENVRVPLIFIAKGKIPAGRMTAVTTLADLAPTICDLLGLESPVQFEGTSALTESERIAFFTTDYSMRLYGLRSGPWKFIHEMDTGFSRLYNLSTDPLEQTNLASSHPDRVQAFLWRHSPTNGLLQAGVSLEMSPETR
jgi:glucan phosphoethanolaminetransferase (alkaline phosphatase superfamily)